MGDTRTQQQPTSIPYANTGANTTASVTNNSTQTIWMIVGISAGAVIFVICCVIILYCVITKRRPNSEEESKTVSGEKGGNETVGLIEELNRNNQYMKKGSKNETMHKDPDGGYLTLSHNGEESQLCSIYSDVPSSTDPNTVSKKPLPIPLPRSEHLGNKDSNVDFPSVRRPIPTPRPEKSKKNNELFFAADTKEAENELYGAPDILEAEDGIYSEPEVNETSRGKPTSNLSFEEVPLLNNTRPSTSAQMFSSSLENSDCHDEEAGKGFALYVPLPVSGEQDIIYKIPSNMQKFDPPKCPPTPANKLEDIYANMDAVSYEELPTNSDYEDVSNVNSISDDYEIMDRTPGNDTHSATYENLTAMGLNKSDHSLFDV